MPAIVIPAPISSNHAAPVSAGGTGATTAAAARTNLDVYSKSEVTNAISQSTANTMISCTTTSDFQLSYNNSYYITDKVARILCRFKVLSVPSTSDVEAISLPSGMTVYPSGEVIPVYKSSNGEWSAVNQIIYCYAGRKSFTLHKSDIAVGDWILLDHVVRLA